MSVTFVRELLSESQPPAAVATPRRADQCYDPRCTIPAGHPEPCNSYKAVTPGQAAGDPTDDDLTRIFESAVVTEREPNRQHLDGWRAIYEAGRAAGKSPLSESTGAKCSLSGPHVLGPACHSECVTPEEAFAKGTGRSPEGTPGGEGKR